MSKWEDIEALLNADELSKTAIAREVGVSRQYVSKVAAEMGKTRPKIPGTGMFIPDDVEIPPSAQKAHTFVMLKAMEADLNRVELPKVVKARLKGFKAELENHVWTYSRVLGWQKLPRDKDKHGDKPFVRIEDTILHNGTE